MVRRMLLTAVVLAGAAVAVVLSSDGAGAASAPPVRPLVSVQVAGLPSVAVPDPFAGAPDASAPAPAPMLDVPLGSLGVATVTPPPALAPVMQPVSDAVDTLTTAPVVAGLSAPQPLAPVVDTLRTLLAGVSGTTAGVTSIVDATPLETAVDRIARSAPAIIPTVGATPMGTGSGTPELPSLPLPVLFAGVAAVVALAGANGTGARGDDSPPVAIVTALRWTRTRAFAMVEPGRPHASRPGFALLVAQPG